MLCRKVYKSRCVRSARFDDVFRSLGPDMDGVDVRNICSHVCSALLAKRRAQNVPFEDVVWLFKITVLDQSEHDVAWLSVQDALFIPPVQMNVYVLRC